MKSTYQTLILMFDCYLTQTSLKMRIICVQTAQKTVIDWIEMLRSFTFFYLFIATIKWNCPQKFQTNAQQLYVRYVYLYSMFFSSIFCLIFIRGGLSQCVDQSMFPFDLISSVRNNFYNQHLNWLLFID